MLRVKGFVTISSLVSNSKDITSRLGELSPISRTFSKDIGEYVNSAYPGYILNTFNAVDSVTSEHVVLMPSDVEFCLGVIRSIYSYSASNIRPYNVADHINTVNRAFQGVITGLQFGSYYTDTNIDLPEWVEFSNTLSGATYRIWLADEAFQRQYDLFEIEIVPFLNNVDDFFLPYETISAALDATSMSKFMEKIQTVKAEHPETILYIQDYDLVNRQNTIQKRPVPWGVLVYGYQGDNIDYIKDAIIDYLLSNSSHTREEWEVLFPDIFKRTEFSIYPRWDLIAVPNLTNMSAIHRAIVDHSEVTGYILRVGNQYSDNHILANIQTIPHTYKYVSLVAIPGETNPSHVRRIYDLYPDYVPVQNTALDFARMTKKTRDWSNFLYDLITVAETATKYSTIPVNMRRMVRRGRIYITAVFDSVNYLVHAKIND